MVSGIVEVSSKADNPAGKYDAYSLKDLEKMKQDAIDNEDFEKAAEIRDEIKRREK